MKLETMGAITNTDGRKIVFPMNMRPSTMLFVPDMIADENHCHGMIPQRRKAVKSGIDDFRITEKAKL